MVDISQSERPTWLKASEFLDYLRRNCKITQQQNTAYLCYLSNLFTVEELIPHFLENNNKTIDY